MKMLELKNIKVKYGRVTFIQDLSLDIEEGEIVSVLGANGAGKTTIIRSILGLTPIAAGEIIHEGDAIHTEKPHKIVARGIGIVPEGRGIFPKLTVDENLKTGFVFLKDDESLMQERMEDAYRRFPILGERRSQLAGTLSGGEQTMLSISRAMMSQPKLLLMDEPSLGLSPLLVKQTFAIVRELHESGTSILLIEQNARQALAVCDRGYILQKGKIVLSGPKKDLVSNESVQKAYFAID